MSLEVFKKPSSIGIFTPMFLFYTCLPPFVFCYKNGLVIPMFSAVMFLFVAGYPAGADLWPHGVCAEAGRFCLPQAGGPNTIYHTLPLIATNFLVLSVQLAAIYFILLQLPL